MKPLFYFVLFFLSVHSYAGQIADDFAEGFLDTVWGQSVKETMAVFPSGEYIKSKSARVITVNDYRPVLGISRDKAYPLAFAFDADERLYYIGVVYKGEEYSEILSKLDSRFGSHKANGALDYESEKVFISRWPKDESIEVKLMLMPTTLGHITSLSVEYFGLPKKIAQQQKEPASDNQLYKRYVDLTKCLMLYTQPSADGTRVKPGSTEIGWQQCKDERLAILALAPPSERANFEKRLEAVKVSIARSMEVKPVSERGYGRNSKDPVMSGSLRNTAAYFARLTNTDNKPVKYKRFGSCCRFPSPNGPFGGYAMMDKYEVTYEGLEKPIVVFVNNYDQGVLKPVAGFNLSKPVVSE